MHTGMTDLQFYSPAFILEVVYGQSYRKFIQGSHGDISIGRLSVKNNSSSLRMQGPLLLTWFNFYVNKDKWSHVQ